MHCMYNSYVYIDIAAARAPLHCESKANTGPEILRDGLFPGSGPAWARLFAQKPGPGCQQNQ